MERARERERERVRACERETAEEKRDGKRKESNGILRKWQVVRRGREVRWYARDAERREKEEEVQMTGAKS